MSEPPDFGEVAGEGTGREAKTVLTFDDGTSFRVREMREGGMGVVYLGELSGGGEESVEVAVKAIRDRLLADVGVRNAFADEAAIWARLSGVPFVLPLIALKKRRGFPYIVTLAVEADERGVVSLGDLLLRSPSGLPVREVFRIALTVALAMTKALQRVPQLVHGDIKPDNVLLVHGLPHLGDFGLSKAVTGGQSGFGARGTLAYLAPEAPATGLSPASDIWAYGCLVHECRTGTPPYGHVDDLDELLRRHEDTDSPAAGLQPEDTLDAGLVALIRRCLRRDVEARPASFEEIVAWLLALGAEGAPEIAERVVAASVYSEKVVTADEHAAEFDSHRLQMLLQSGNYAAVVEEIDRVPEEERSPEQWVAAGSAYSLTGRDEKALECFDQCLALTGENRLVVRCLNEKGLSLKRLKRYDEAIELYEELLETVDQSSLFGVSSNYAATLLEAERLDAALEQALWLTENYRERCEGWVLQGQVRKKRGEFELALECLQRAINVDPNSPQAQFEHAEILAFQYRDLEGALSHLDVAFATGQHSPDLISLLVALNLLLGNEDEVAKLVSALEPLPAETRDAIGERAMEMAKALAARFEGGALGDEIPPDLQVEPGNATGRPGAGSPRALVHEMALCMDEGSELPMMGCRAYITSEMFTVDYYDRSEGNRFVANFGRDFVKFCRRAVPKLGILHFRNSMLGVARCQSCSFEVLTNRSEDELFLCRMCDERGAVVFDRSPDKESFVRECEVAAQLQRENVGGVLVLLSFWESRPYGGHFLERLGREQGWQVIEEKEFSAVLASYFARQHGAVVSGEPSVQLLRRLPENEQRYRDTYWSVQRLLQAIHPRLGRIPSSSMDIPEETATYFETTRSEIMARQREDLGKSPTDPEDLARLIELVAREDREEARRLVLLSQQLSGREHPTLYRARGVYYLENGELEAARESLQKANQLSPMDGVTRLMLMRLWQALERPDLAEREERELRAIGLHLHP